jgi:UDP-3-O-[3-hydroxymyristoyl] glucosamine N-acyltransferase
MNYTLADLCEMTGGTVDGDSTAVITHPAKIEAAGEGAITFLGNRKYEDYIYTTGATVVIVQEDFIPKQKISASLLRVPDVYTTLGVLLQHFDRAEQLPSGIAHSAVIDPSATIAEDASIGEYVVVGPGCRVGAGARIFSHCYLGADVAVGEHTVLSPGVKVMRSCKIGASCIIHANVVIGSDGFGFAPNASGTYDKVSQIGNVLIEDHVEIGANTVIDRATMGSTIVREGTKLDNLIQVGHNAEIGSHTVIAAQTGVSGSTKIGSRCMIGGQVGFVGHLTIADRTQIQAQSGIASSIKEPGQKLYGYPAIGYRDYLKSYARFRQLPDMAKTIQDLQNQINELKQKI